LMFEKMFESRMFFVDKLISMGARIVLCDPHRAIVAGPSRLRGAPMTSPDIRAGMAMLLAAACAEGTSTINNADQIERGYERIEEITDGSAERSRQDERAPEQQRAGNAGEEICCCDHNQRAAFVAKPVGIRYPVAERGTQRLRKQDRGRIKHFNSR